MPSPEWKKYVPSFDMLINQKRIHIFLEKFKNETYSKHDHILTVEEANGVSAGNAHLWVSRNGKIEMLFQFEHTDLCDHESDQGIDLIGVKKALTCWEKKS